ncbi:Rha family transcriptional regulator [Jeotgalibaca porci]|uniref:Rha family transcriptional regulator n=1 Tax=Jeotgalibaca porci TaxID=1868793 RepID=UPI00359F4691
MKNLVIMKDNKAVTSSLQVADSFEKNHRDVLESVRNLTAENTATKIMFFETTYKNSRGQEYPEFLMNRDGFTLLAMGFTGKKALEFKLKYIQAFNEMEKYLNLTSMSQEDIMIATLKTQKEIKQQLNTVTSDVESLKHEVDLSRYQKAKLSGLVRKNVMDAVGGKRSHAYRELYRTAIAENWREIKNHFNVASYEEIPKLKFEEAMEIAAMWHPSASLAFDIKQLNTQIEMDV